jgi:MoaA/NifB/PqqE/SkfB family radical SAM enzyme
MCDIWRSNARKEEIPAEVLARHLADLRKLRVRWVVLSGGEALLHGNLWELCTLLKSIPVRITLLSTGLLLGKYANEISRWCDEVIVSLDGSEKVHDRIRQIPGAFAKLADGISELLCVNPGFKVTGRCVIQSQNYIDMPKCVDAAREIGLSQVSFLPVDVSTAGFGRNNVMKKGTVEVPLALTRPEVEHFGQIVDFIIERRKDDFDRGFIAESPEKLRRMVHYFRALNQDAGFPVPNCNAPWVSAVVEADGQVRPCFFHEPFGNIKEENLLSIVNSKKATIFRRQLDVHSDPTCERCTCSLYLKSTKQLAKAAPTQTA